MKLRTALFAYMTAMILGVTAGYAVARDQETVGAYVDDSVITTRVKSRFIEDKNVDASAIHVETVNGVVTLSGFSKDLTEKKMAEAIASKVKGVKAVKNELSVRP